MASRREASVIEAMVCGLYYMWLCEKYARGGKTQTQQLFGLVGSEVAFATIGRNSDATI